MSGAVPEIDVRRGPLARPAARLDPLTDAADVALRLLHAHESGAPLHDVKASGRDTEIVQRLTLTDLEEGVWFLMRLGMLDANQTLP